MTRRRAGDVVLAIALLAVLAVLIALRTSLERAQISLPSTYDTGPRGYAALYDLLLRERTRVQRFEEPIGRIADRAGTLVIAGDYQAARVAPTREQRSALDQWVRQGGTLALFGRVPDVWFHDALGVPQTSNVQANRARAGCGLALRNLVVAGDFTGALEPSCTNARVSLLRAGSRAVAIAYRRGKGTIVYSPAATPFDNEHLAQRDNARFAYALLARGPVMFEERGYGYTRSTGFWHVLPLPMRVAVIIACSALLLAVAGANVPFVPPHLPPPSGERDSGEYILSLSRMLRRAGARRAIVARLCAFVQHALGPRAQSDDRARELLERARTLQSLSVPGAEDVVAAAVLFARVQKDYTW